MPFSILALLAGSFFSGLFAQTIIEETVQEEEVKTDDTLTSPSMSKTRAVALSALMPGAGEQYLKHEKRASVHYLCEALIWGGLFACFSTSQRYYEDAKSFASLHAGSQGGVSGKSEKYYEEIADFYDIWERNAVYEANRDLENLYPLNSEYTWRWDSRENFAAYDNLLRKHRTWKMAGGFMIGGIALHRFFSMVDVMRMAKKFRLAGSATPTRNGGEIAVSVHF